MTVVKARPKTKTKSLALKPQRKPRVFKTPVPKPLVLKPRYPLERVEQAELFDHAAHRALTDPRWGLLFAIQNGTAASSWNEAKLGKKTGTKKGVPDMFLPVPITPYHGLFVEMKRRNGRLSDVSAEQSSWLYALQAMGYQTVVAFGWQHAADEIHAYLNPSLNPSQESGNDD